MNLKHALAELDEKISNITIELIGNQDEVSKEVLRRIEEIQPMLPKIRNAVHAVFPDYRLAPDVNTMTVPINVLASRLGLSRDSALLRVQSGIIKGKEVAGEWLVEYRDMVAYESFCNENRKRKLTELAKQGVDTGGYV